MIKAVVVLIIFLSVIITGYLVTHKSNQTMYPKMGCHKQSDPECYRCYKSTSPDSSKIATPCFSETECSDACPKLLQSKCWSDYDCPSTSTSIGRCDMPETESAKCEYTQIDNETKCVAISKNNAGLKIVFIPNAIKRDSLAVFRNDLNRHIEFFNQTEPFKRFKDKITFYFLDTATDFGYNGNSPQNEILNNVVDKYCGRIDEKIVVLDEKQPGTAPIYGIPNGHLAVTSIDSPWTTLHEFAHSFGGLHDNYIGWMLINGNPTQAQVDAPNTDVAGCPKWCSGYKSSYQTSCTTISSEDGCRHYGRTLEKTNDAERWSCDDPYKCCVWLDQPDPYFKTRCVPFRGNVNIGEDCYQNTGCYYGSNGQGAWRPTLNDGIMADDQRNSNYFDAVSVRALTEKLNKY